MPDYIIDNDEEEEEEEIVTGKIAEIKHNGDNSEETVKKKVVVVDDDHDEDLPSPKKQPSLDLIFVDKFWNSRKKEFISTIFPQFFVQTLFKHQVFNENDMQEYNEWLTDSGNINDPDGRRRIYKDLVEKIWKILWKKIQKNPDRLVHIVQVLRMDDWYNEMADEWQLHIDDEWNKLRQQQLEHDEYLRKQNVGLPGYGVPISLKDRERLKMINFPEPIAKHIDRKTKRKEIKNLLKQFAKEGKGWLILYGIHGSGKTVLAESSVRRLKPELYEHGIFWIQIGDLSSTEEMFDQTLYLKMEILYDSIRFLHGGLESTKSDKLEKIKVDLKRHFQLKPKSLLILDDVRSKHTLKHFNFGVPVLVTTIDRSVACNMDNIDYNFVSITIDGTDTILNKDESYDLLLKHLPSIMHPYYLKNSRYLPNILETVNGIPYYIPLIANYMMPFADRLGIFNQERSDNLDSTIWKELSEMLHDNLCNKLLMQTIDEIKKQEPELVEYLYDFSIFFDPIPLSVLNVLWGKKFDKHPRITMGQIVQQLINKSLLKVHCGVRKSTALIENKLYSIHDLTACFLMEQLGPEKQKERHSILIDTFETYLKNDANVLVNDDNDQEREQIKNYIHHCLSLHIYSSGRYDLFPKYFLDLNFLKEKIRYVGQSHILVEFENFRNCFNGWQKRMEDMHRFIASSADISEPSKIDLFQLALCQPNDSFVYSEAIKKLDQNEGFYFEWCNKDNYALENQLVKLRFKCKDNTKYASLSPSSNYIATINNCDLNLYDGKTGNLVKCQKRHNKTINHCTFSRNGEYILTTSNDGKAILWRSPLTTITATSNNQTTTAAVEPLRKRTSSYNSALQQFKEFMSMPTKMKADSSNADIIVTKYKCGDLTSNNRWALLGTTTGFIHLYSVDKSQLITKLSNPEYLEYKVETCCFAPNDSYFIFSMNHFVFVYKFDPDANNNNNDSIQAITQLYTLKHDEKVYNAVFNPRPKSRSHPIDIFTSSGKQVCQWTLKNHSFFSYGARTKTKPHSKYVLPAGIQGLISYCTVSPTGDSVAGFECSRHEIYIWNVQKKSMKAARSNSIPLHTLSNIYTMSFSSDGGRLLSLNTKNEITFWDIKEFDTVSSVVDLKDDFAAAINEKFSMLNVLTIDKKGFVRLFEGKTGIENQNFKTSLKEKLNQFCDGDGPNPIRINIVCCDISTNGYSIFCTEYGDVFFFCNFETTLLNHQQPDSEKILKCKFLPNRSNNDDYGDDDRDPISIPQCSHHNSPAKFVTMTEKKLCFYQAFCGLRIHLIDYIPTRITDIILESFWFVSAKILIFWTRDNICHFVDCDRMQSVKATPELGSTITSVHSCKKNNIYSIVITLADKALVVLSCDKNIQRISLIAELECRGETPRCCQICPNYLVYGCDSGKICLIKSLPTAFNRVTYAVIEWTRQHSKGSYVNYLAISMDEKYIVSAADSIKLWNSIDGTLLQTFISHGEISRLFVHFSGAPSTSTSTSTTVGSQDKDDDDDQEADDDDEEEEDGEDDEDEEESDSIEDHQRMDQIDGQTSSTMKDINVIIVAITQAKSLYILENYKR